MQRRTRFTQAGVALVIWAAVVSAASACKAPDPEGSGTTTGGNVGGGGSGGGGSSPTPGVVDNTAGFRIVLTGTSTSKFVMHDTTDTTTWTTACKVDASAVGTNASNIFCTIEAPEADLYFQGVHLNYNVPTSMCTYLRVAPYGYFNQLTEDGDGQVTYWVDKDGILGIDANTDGVVDTVNRVRTGGALSTLTTINNGKLTCVYDLSSVGLKNCCIGTYSMTVFNWDPTANAGAGGYKSTTSSNIDWGGNPTSCYEGPFKDLATFRTTSGIPLSTIYYTEGSGFNSNMDLQAPDKKKFGSNAYLANYIDPADHGGPAVPASFIQPSISKPAPAVQPYYDFGCLDHAFEYKARIRVQIRDWNLYSEWAKKGSGTADTVGLETAPYNGFGNNDMRDWRDWELAAPGLAFPYESE